MSDTNQQMERRTSIDDILRRTSSTLANAKQGLDDFLSGDPTRRKSGLHNLVVFGRSVTWVLQNLSTPLGSAFQHWYQPHQDEMRSDSLMRFMVKTRNEIAKEGKGELGASSVYIGYFDSSMIQRYAPPIGASDFFVGDELGGSGWIVEMPDGSTQRFYVQLPNEVGFLYRAYPEGAPTVHLGRPIADPSWQTLAVLYYRYLEKLVAEAKREFGVT